MGVGSLHNPWEYDGRLPPDLGYYLDLVIPRFEEPRKKTPVMLNNTMEEYRNRVIKLHAIYSKIISKSTSNISKNTSKFTSKTDQIRLGGPGGSGRGIHLGEARTISNSWGYDENELWSPTSFP